MTTMRLYLYGKDGEVREHSVEFEMGGMVTIPIDPPTQGKDVAAIAYSIEGGNTTPWFPISEGSVFSSMEMRTQADWSSLPKTLPFTPLGAGLVDE